MPDLDYERMDYLIDVDPIKLRDEAWAEIRSLRQQLAEAQAKAKGIHLVRQEAEVRAERDALERAVLQEIGERDRNAEWADRLAYAIAPIEVIGEHSSMNDPWSNAIEEAERQRAEREALAGQLEYAQHDAGAAWDLHGLVEVQRDEADAEIGRLRLALLAAAAEQPGKVQAIADLTADRDDLAAQLAEAHSATAIAQSILGQRDVQVRDLAAQLERARPVLAAIEAWRKGFGRVAYSEVEAETHHQWRQQDAIDLAGAWDAYQSSPPEPAEAPVADVGAVSAATLDSLAAITGGAVRSQEFSVAEPFVHVYLSTSCLHALQPGLPPAEAERLHAYCRALGRPDGKGKRPGVCKFCGSVCICPVCNHQPEVAS